MTHTKHKGLLCMFKVAMEGKQYLEAFFWEDKERMLKTTEMEEAEAIALECVYTISIQSAEGEQLRLPHKFGEVHIPIDVVGAGVAAHELLHILLFYIQVLELDLNKDEERICHLYGIMVSDFWKRFYENFREVKSGPKG